MLELLSIRESVCQHVINDMTFWCTLLSTRALPETLRNHKALRLVRSLIAWKFDRHCCQDSCQFESNNEDVITQYHVFETSLNLMKRWSHGILKHASAEDKIMRNNLHNKPVCTTDPLWPRVSSADKFEALCDNAIHYWCKIWSQQRKYYSSYSERMVIQVRLHRAWQAARLARDMLQRDLLRRNSVYMVGSCGAWLLHIIHVSAVFGVSVLHFKENWGNCSRQHVPRSNYKFKLKLLPGLAAVVHLLHAACRRVNAPVVFLCFYFCSAAVTLPVQPCCLSRPV